MKAFTSQLLLLLVTAMPAVAQPADTQKLYHYDIGMYSRQPIFGNASVFKAKNPQLSERWGQWAQNFSTGLSEGMQQTSGCQGRGKFLIDIYRDGQTRVTVFEASSPAFAQHAVSAIYSMATKDLMYPTAPSTDCFHLYLVLGAGPLGARSEDSSHVQNRTIAMPSENRPGLENWGSITQSPVLFIYP